MKIELQAGKDILLTHSDDMLKELLALNKRHDHLKRGMFFLVSCFVASLAILLLSFDSLKPKVISTYENNILKVRGIIVVDSNGVERVWMGAPATDPLVFGRRLNRGEGFNGILLFDKTGTERSGYGTFDNSNSVGITLDESGRMVANFIAQDAGGVKLTILDEYDNQIGLGTSHKGPYLKMLQRGDGAGGTNKLLLIKADSTRGMNLVK